jgi:hypothetical protein
MAMLIDSIFWRSSKERRDSHAGLALVGNGLIEQYHALKGRAQGSKDAGISSGRFSKSHAPELGGEVVELDAGLLKGFGIFSRLEEVVFGLVKVSIIKSL